MICKYCGEPEYTNGFQGAFCRCDKSKEGFEDVITIRNLKQQLAEANELLKRCEHKLVYYLSGEPAHELAEAIKEHLK